MCIEPQILDAEHANPTFDGNAAPTEPRVRLWFGKLGSSSNAKSDRQRQRVTVNGELAIRPLRVADSTRRRNSFMKSLCWRFVVQRLSRSFVEAPRDRVELGLRIFGEVDPLGEILPQ